MNRQPETATDDPLLQPCSLCSFAVSECRKGKIPARLQELQTANGRFHLQESTKESIMTEYRFHLQKYRPAARPPVRSAAGSPVSPVISTRRERLPSLTTWASATISTVAATATPRRSISGTIRLSKKN